LIARLDDKIKELKFDIKAFNAYVLTQVNAINAHGVLCPELLTNLFTAYKQVQDAEFEQQDCMYFFQYTSATLCGQEQDLTREVMLAMEQNYHCCVTNGTWNPKQLKTGKERIIALESTIVELKAGSGSSPPNNNSWNFNNNNRSNRNNRNSNQSKWAWKSLPQDLVNQHLSPRTRKSITGVQSTNSVVFIIQESAVAFVATEDAAPNITSNKSVQLAVTDQVLQSLAGARGRVFA
jgi:hypothetical protein